MPYPKRIAYKWTMAYGALIHALLLALYQPPLLTMVICQEWLMLKNSMAVVTFIQYLIITMIVDIRIVVGCTFVIDFHQQYVIVNMVHKVDGCLVVAIVPLPSSTTSLIVHG